MKLLRGFQGRAPALLAVTLRGNVSAGKVRKGGYIFLWWRGDHAPRHVHVYRHGRLAVKWDPDSDRPMAGAASAKILRLIRELRQEGEL